MNYEEHKKRHLELHRNLDELVADMIQHSAMLPSQTTVFELMFWSNQQRGNPTTEGKQAITFPKVMEIKGEGE